MKHTWDGDIQLYERNLYGEGRWIVAYGFEDRDGNVYEIWQDQDGDEKIVENV